MVINNLISNQTLAQNASISTKTLSTSFKHSFQAQFSSTKTTILQ